MKTRNKTFPSTTVVHGLLFPAKTFFIPVHNHMNIVLLRDVRCIISQIHETQKNELTQFF